MEDFKQLVNDYLTKSQERLEKVIEALNNLRENKNISYQELLDYMCLTFHGSDLMNFIKTTQDITDNVPYKLIEEYVNEDLSKYGQSNPAPLSLTITSENGSFRHYELGACVGYILYGTIHENSAYCNIMISEIHEDDEHWFAPSTPMYMDVAWLKGTIHTLQRVQKWYQEHIKVRFENGKYYTEFLKPIEDEIVFEKNGESSCPVLGGPEL